jgi:hypothetical protein
MNTALIAIPHPTTKDTAGIPILDDIDSEISDNNLLYKIDSNKVHLPKLSVMSPELKEQQRDVVVNKLEKGFSSIKVNLDSVKIYAVLQ